MKIVDGDGKELPWDGKAFGDLKVRGPWVTEAYFGDAPGSALDAEGWFATGDVATIDPEGFMEITDRSKDVIKSGGEWISSIALENIAVSHPDVAEAAVVAATHAKWDERPVLIVDLSQPTAVCAAVRAMGNVHVAAAGGTVLVPGTPDFVMASHLPAGRAFACAAEAMLLALAPEATRDLPLIGPIVPEAAVRLEQLAETLGMLASDAEA